MASDVQIRKLKKIKSDKELIRTEIYNLRDIRDELTQAIGLIEDYESIRPYSQGQTILKGTNKIIKSLKATFKNIRNYANTMVAFNKDDLADIDMTGGTIAKSTSAPISTQSTSTTPSTKKSTPAKSSTTAAATTAAATTTVAATTKGTVNNSKLNIGGSYTSSQIKNKDGYYAVPSGNTSPKAYESYAGITLKGSPERAISHGETYKGVKYDTHTDAATGMRYVNIGGERYYCVATGTAYGNVGDKLEITTSTGKTFKAIKTDTKRTNDSNSKNVIINGKTQSVAHGFGDGRNCVIEMVCDTSCAPSKVRNWGSYDALDQFSGSIVSMRNLGSTFK